MLLILDPKVRICKMFRNRTLPEVPYRTVTQLTLSHMAYFVLFITWSAVQLNPHMKNTFEQCKTILMMS
jgi:hypothetical protein